jgi:CelD/BcsL family acetyltransferase involved in cellulose biosynthesis
MSVVRVLSGFDDPACCPEEWSRLSRLGNNDLVFLTREWLEPWWKHRGEGQLLLVAAVRGGELTALAPLYAIDGMVLFLGSGESDYLDFLGDTSDTSVMVELLDAARASVANFVGFKFELVPSRSRTRTRLEHAAACLGLDCYLKSEIEAFDVDLVAHQEFLRTAAHRSMLKRENFFCENGEFQVRRLRDADSISSGLNAFFEQHVSRWKNTSYESPFSKPRPRAWLGELADRTARAGWLRVVQLDWNQQLLGMAFAWHYQGIHYCGPWSFAIEHGKHCPGHVLLRHSLLDALDEGLHTYDLRGGYDSYKSRFPTRSKFSQTWCLYPSSG